MIVYPWTDTMTVLVALDGKRMAKTLLPSGQFRDYDSAYLYDAHTLHLDGLQSLRAALERHLRMPDRCIVRGALIGGETARSIRRLAYLDKKTGDVATLRDTAHRWLALDWDSIARPPHIPADDLLGCADVLFDLLPPAFAMASAIVQASAGHGIKPGIRFRLWFWCDRPITGSEAKQWLADSPVDASIFWPVQPIYTAAPIFAPGAFDHLTARLIEWPGQDWLKVPPPETLMPAPRPVPEYVRPVHTPGSARGALYADAALAGARARIRSATHRHPTILQEACSLARLVHARLIDTERLHSALWSAAKGAGKDDESEIARIVDFAMTNVSTFALPEGVAHG